MRLLGKYPISMSNGQRESWHRERVWVRYQKKDLPSASSCSRLPQALSPTNSRLLSTTPPQKYMFYVVFNRGLISYWSQPCSMQTQMREKNQFGSHSALLFSKFTGLSLSLSLCLFNGERTALCSNFEQWPCGHSSPSYSRELCYSTKKSGATPLLDQMA